MVQGITYTDVASTQIAFGSTGNSITLVGVDPDTLGAMDFKFA
jgi:hypothetical protein